MAATGTKIALDEERSTLFSEEAARMNRWIVTALIGVALSLAAQARAESRVEWETGTPEITERHSDSPSEAHRVAALCGRLSSLSRSDVRLYAVYLHRRSQLHDLVDVLREAGSPAAWRGAAGSETLRRFLDGPGSYEWIELKPNGGFTLFADNHRQPDKDYVVIVNGAGDILGARPLWAAPDDGDLADVGTVIRPSL
jgi:hypothetical protein